MMKINLLVSVEVNQENYATEKGVPLDEVPENLLSELTLMSDGLTWRVILTELLSSRRSKPSDVVQTILARPRTGTGGGIPLTRGEVAMLFLDGHAGDGPGLLDIRSQGYGEDDDWDGLTYDDVLNNTDELPGEAAFVWTKWEPLELWSIGPTTDASGQNREP